MAVVAAAALGLALVGPNTAAAQPRAGASAARVAGTVVNSRGRPLPRLAITVYGQTPSGREVPFHARTDRRGRFALASGAARIHALRWTATAAFRWYGGTWVRVLNTIGSRPGHLKFRADVVSRGQDSLATGVLLRIDDTDGCDTLAPSDPAFVATDPGTQSITLLLRPARRLVDGTVARAGTVTLTSGALCGFEGEGHQISLPAGAWTVTGVTNSGRELAFSTQLGSGPYTRSLTVFDFPQSSSQALEDIDVHFAA